MKRKLMRENPDDRTWCRIEVELKEPGSQPNPHHTVHELTVCASDGEILTEAEAQERAIEYWKGYFEEDRENLGDMAIRFGTRTPEEAARKVVEVDGPYHGVDTISSPESEHMKPPAVRPPLVVDGNVYVYGGGGMFGDRNEKWFPEVAHWTPWHLNCMKAACEHQEEMGWSICRGYHKPGESCPAPLVPLPWARVWTCGQAWDLGCKSPEDFKARAQKFTGKFYPVGRFYEGGSFLGWPNELPKRGEKCPQKPWLAVAGQANAGLCPKCGQAALKSTPAMPWAMAYREANHYGSDGKCENDALCAPCPTCGYGYGTKWLERKLPDDILAEVQKFIETGELPAPRGVPA